MRIIYILVLFSVVFSLGLLTTSYAQCENCDIFLHLSDSVKHYVFLSEEYFFVYGIDGDQIIPIDGGVYYNSEWRIFNMTDVIVRQFDDGKIVWIEEGTLENSDEQFWFTWNLSIPDTGYVTVVYIYDGEILTELSDYNTYKNRLFLG